MASAVATTSSTQQGCPPPGSMNGSTVDCSGFPLLDQLKAKFNIDGVDIDGTKSIMELADIEEDDLPPFSFDFENIWDKVSAEINIEDDFSAVLQQITDSYTDVAVGSMQFKLRPEDIVEGISEDILKLPPLDDLKDLLGTLTSARKPDEVNSSLPADGPVIKKVRGEKTTGESRKKSYDADTQYVFVNDVATNQKKVITLKKGAKLPKGFEIASIQGDLPPLPGELSSITADALKNAILGVANTSPPPKSSSPVTKPVLLPPPPPSPPKVRSATPKKRDSEVNKLNSLSELMTAEMERKEKSQTLLQKPRLVYKQRNSNPSKVVSLINKAATIGIARPEQIMDVDIEPVSKEPEPSSTRVIGQITDTIRIVVPTEPAIDLDSPTHSLSPEAYHTDSDNTNMSCFFVCKICDQTFFCYNDNLFRVHLLIRHNLENSDDAYFESSKVYANAFRRCIKCKLPVLDHFEEHKKRCLPMASMEDAFEEECLADNLEKMACGICPAEFDIRYELKSHMEEAHPNVARIMIFEPHFRCSRCLKRFDESLTLAKHCAKCRETRPRQDTLMELAKSVLYCEDCETKHQTIETTLACYMGLDIRRCLLCMAVFKNKALYFKHLRMYHGVLFNPKLRVPCPACEDRVFTTIGLMTQHWVHAHLAPMLTQVNQDVSNLPFTSGVPKNLVPEKQKGVKTVTKKIPDLQPIFPKHKSVNTNLPPGIVINTSRINPIRMTASTTTIAPAPMKQATPTPKPDKPVFTFGKMQDGKMILIPRTGPGNAGLPNRAGQGFIRLTSGSLGQTTISKEGLESALPNIVRPAGPKQYARAARNIAPNQLRHPGSNISVRTFVPNPPGSSQAVRIIGPNQQGSNLTVQGFASYPPGPSQVRTIAPNQPTTSLASNQGVKTITLKPAVPPTASNQYIRQIGLNVTGPSNNLIAARQIRAVTNPGSQVVRLITTTSGLRAIGPNPILGAVGSSQVIRTVSTTSGLRAIAPKLPVSSGSPNIAIRSTKLIQSGSVNPHQIVTSQVIRPNVPNQVVRPGSSSSVSRAVAPKQLIRLMDPNGEVVNAIFGNKPSSGSVTPVDLPRTSSGSETTEPVANTEKESAANSAPRPRTIVIGGKTFHFEVMDPKQTGSAQITKPGTTISISQSKESG